MATLGNDLVDRLRRRDADAWGSLHRAVVPTLRASAHRALKGGDGADDVVADVFLRAWCSIDRYEPSGGRPVLAWLYGIQRNVVRERLRQLRRPALTTDLVPVEDAASVVVRKEDGAAAVAALRQMDECVRRIVYFRVVDRRSAHQVASMVGAQPAAVRMAQARALRRLRVTLATPAMHSP